MKKQKGYATAVGLFVLALFVVGGIGWGMNLYKLFNLTDAAGVGEVIARILGVIPFIGAFVGWF